MDDDEAFMQLVLGNTQGELSPLEIGLHALKAVPLEQGKAGGGLAGYAEQLGRDKSGITQLRKAAEVFKGVDSSQQVALTDKAKHLYEISKTDPSHWQSLVDKLIAMDWTVKQVQAAVQKIRDDELALLEAEERAKQKEADAEAFLQDRAPALLQEVGEGKRFISASVAKSHWEAKNREEAARLERERRETEKREKEERKGRSELYSGIAKGLLTVGVYGRYEDIPKLMSEFNPGELSSPDLLKYFEMENLTNAARFIAELIEWSKTNAR